MCLEKRAEAKSSVSPGEAQLLLKLAAEVLLFLFEGFHELGRCPTQNNNDDNKTTTTTTTTKTSELEGEGERTGGERGRDTQHYKARTGGCSGFSPPSRGRLQAKHVHIFRVSIFDNVQFTGRKKTWQLRYNAITLRVVDSHAAIFSGRK